jgi:NADPH:quinone reductase-like Zn-dependent oxidoreductase
MRNLVIFGTRDAGAAGLHPYLGAVTVDNVTVRCGIVRTPGVAFDPGQLPRGVLVRVCTVSCNYRDKSFFFRMQGIPAGRFMAIGSEFAGEVVAVGEAVETLRPGDRVIPNHHYEGVAYGRDGLRAGVATNHGSKEFQVLFERKLSRVPATMPLDVAAAFGLNAQTAYSMVRRVAPAPGARVLVTSGAANTSLFLIGALRKYDVRIYASTTSAAAGDRLRALGVDEVIHCPREDGGFAGSGAVERFADEVGGFDHVFDPFYDLHLEKSVEILNPFGTYITCGLVGQNQNSARAAGVSVPRQLDGVMLKVMTKNLSLVGNCIGLRQDLEEAVRDHAAGRLTAVVDSVHSGEDVSTFLNRTFNDGGRFGKVVFRYD